MVQVSDAVKSRIPRGPRAVSVVALSFWAVAGLAFAWLQPGSARRYVAANAVYYAAVIFVLVCVARAVSGGRAVSGARGRQRLVWSLLGAGLIAGLAAARSRPRSTSPSC